jgi:hypothetical protein
MSTRTSLIYIMIAALLLGYVGLHWGLAADLEVTVRQKWTGTTYNRRGGTGSAHFVETDQGTFGFLGMPFSSESDEMYAQLREGEQARVKVIQWLHGPILAGIVDSVSRPLIIEVRP